MKIAYDPKKNEKNIRERGLSFARADELDFITGQSHRAGGLTMATVRAETEPREMEKALAISAEPPP